MEASSVVYQGHYKGTSFYLSVLLVRSHSLCCSSCFLNKHHMVRYVLSSCSWMVILTVENLFILPSVRVLKPTIQVEYEKESLFWYLVLKYCITGFTSPCHFIWNLSLVKLPSHSPMLKNTCVILKIFSTLIIFFERFCNALWSPVTYSLLFPSFLPTGCGVDARSQGHEPAKVCVWGRASVPRADLRPVPWAGLPSCPLSQLQWCCGTNPLNPKAMSVIELYGILDPDARDWTDGPGMWMLFGSRIWTRWWMTTSSSL